MLCVHVLYWCSLIDIKYLVEVSSHFDFFLLSKQNYNFDYLVSKSNNKMSKWRFFCLYKLFFLANWHVFYLFSLHLCAEKSSGASNRQPRLSAVTCCHGEDSDPAQQHRKVDQSLNWTPSTGPTTSLQDNLTPQLSRCSDTWCGEQRFLCLVVLTLSSNFWQP